MAPRATNLRSWSDEDLIQAYRKEGHSDYVGELFQRYTDLVFLVGMKYLKDEVEAEDMTMRMFEKLLKDLRRYEIQQFKFWLHKVVKHQCLAILDKQKREREKQEHFQLDQAAIMENGHEPDLLGEIGEREQLLQYLEQALTQLQDHQRICVELFYLQKKSYQEVAAATGYSLKEVKSYLQNGKRNLKNRIEALAGSELRDH